MSISEVLVHRALKQWPDYSRKQMHMSMLRLRCMEIYVDAYAITSLNITQDPVNWQRITLIGHRQICEHLRANE